VSDQDILIARVPAGSLCHLDQEAAFRSLDAASQINASKHYSHIVPMGDAPTQD